MDCMANKKLRNFAPRLNERVGIHEYKGDDSMTIVSVEARRISLVVGRASRVKGGVRASRVKGGVRASRVKGG